MENLKVGSTIYKIHTSSSLGNRLVRVQEMVIVRETETRWILGHCMTAEIDIQLLKKDLSVYGKSFNSERFYAEIPQQILDIQKEERFRTDARVLVESFANDHKRYYREEDEELREVLAVLSKYRNADGSKKAESIQTEQ